MDQAQGEPALLFAGKESDVVLAEYNTLRTELLQRTGTRSQLINLLLTAFGAVLGAAALTPQGSALLLLYPLLALALLNGYLSNSLKIQRIKQYLVHPLEDYVQTNLPTAAKEQLFRWHTTYQPVEKVALGLLFSC